MFARSILFIFCSYINFLSTENVPSEAPYGYWSSPLNSTYVATTSTKLTGPVYNHQTGSVFWGQSINGANMSIFEFIPESGSLVNWTPEGFVVKTSINTYGGEPFTICNGGIIFSEKNNSLYIQYNDREKPKQIAGDGKKKYGDLSCVNDSELIAVVEEKVENEKIKTKQAVVLINLNDGSEKQLTIYKDFYVSPKISPDLTLIAFCQRDSPNMPWDWSALYVAEISLSNLIDGAHDHTFSFHNSSVMMIKWNKKNQMFFVSDASGFWNLYVMENNNVTNLTPLNEDVGGPLWLLGVSAYDISPVENESFVIAVIGKKLFQIDYRDGKRTLITDKYEKIINPVYSTNGQKVYFIAGSTTSWLSLIEIHLVSKLITTVNNKNEDLLPNYISQPKDVTFKTGSLGEVAHGQLYLPKNPDHFAPSNSKPPLIIYLHGGPTGAGRTYLKLSTQFFTTRGFAFFSLDYRGSTGYGKEFWKKLYSNWGIYDVEDTISAAQYFIEENIVNPNNIFVVGGSAGGYTTLGTLATTNIFKGGVSYYGISNMTKLDEETHWFEKGYLHLLIGPKERFIERSPITHINKIKSAVLFFQGTDDTVVPLEQSTIMNEELQKREIPSEIVVFEGEGHGFDKPQNRITAIEKELKFYKNLLT